MKKRNPVLIILIVLVFICLCASVIVFMLVGSARQWLAETLPGISLPDIAGLPTELPAMPDLPLPEPTSSAGEAAATPETSSASEPVYVTGASPVIYLAGRSDIVIPNLDDPSDILLFQCRSGTVQETYPMGYRIAPGAEFTFSASGMVNFYGGEARDGYPPDGDTYGSLADLLPFGGISGYKGPAGALMGVFIDDNIPNGTPPEPISFYTDGGMGIDFDRLSPQLGQLFFIGDGKNSSGAAQVFIAPQGATRLYIGLADGASFYGDPGCYADNTGSFDFTVKSNQDFKAIP